MDPQTFEAELHAGGFKEIATRSLAANHATTPHSHPFEVSALVIDGEISLGVDGRTTRYRAGEIFTMAPGREHTESVGPDGVTTLAGRRYEPAA